MRHFATKVDRGEALTRAVTLALLPFEAQVPRSADRGIADPPRARQGIAEPLTQGLRQMAMRTP
jgi:hypothetical protein